MKAPTLVFFVLGVTVRSSTLPELRLLGLLPMNDDGGSCLPAVQLALDHINADDRILNGFNLTYNWIDSQCDPGVAVYRMFDRLSRDDPYVMVLGDGCSNGSEATAQVSYLWNLTQLSYASSSPTLSNRKRFPRFFRMVTPDQKLNAARIDLMKKFNWFKVATINQALEFFSLVTDDFIRRIQNTNISIISQEIFVNDPFTRVHNLKVHDVRIIMTGMYEDKARAILCAAYKIGLYGSKIVWVFVGWYSADFWKTDLDTVECTEEEMNLAAEGAFFTGPVFKSTVDENGIANLSVSEFEKQYYSYPTYNPSKNNTDYVAPLCYDHIWIAAIALNCTVQTLMDMGHTKTLDMFNYTDGDINDVIYRCMSKVSMTGVSGRVVFRDNEADPNRVIKIERIQEGKRVKVALYRQDADPNYFIWEEGVLVWKDGYVPRDSTYITYREVEIPVYLFAPLTTLAGIGIALAIGLLVFNIVYRKNKFVKLSSPNINNILLLGCILCYVTVFIKTTSTFSTVICKARVFCLNLGFTVTFGSLFSKTWRVYRIFTNKRLQKRVRTPDVTIKDYQLLGIIGGMVGVILLVLVVWEIIGPHTIRINYLQNEIYVTGMDAEVHPFVRVCESDLSGYFSWVLYLLQGSFLIFGAFLAWETRHVKIEALNDSHQIGLCLYNAVILSAVGLTLSLLLDDQDILMYGITSGFLIVGTTVTQVVIFYPKIHAVRNKIEETALSTVNNEMRTTSSSGRQQDGSDPISSIYTSKSPKCVHCS